MSKDPAILFYTSDFLSGTAFFSDEQRGQYIKLLCEQHQNGHIPDAHMIEICKSYDSPVFKKFIKDSSGLYFNERMEGEILRRVSYSVSRRKNRIGESKEEVLQSYDKTHDSTYDSGVSTHMETETITDTYNGIKSINVPFEIFWDLYNKDIDRIKCEVVWMQLPNEERLECILKLPEYIKSTPDKKFRSNPEKYLKNKGWRNEILASKDKATSFIDANKSELLKLKKQVYGNTV